MPTIAKRIHVENEAGNFKRNLAGLGIGNGVTAPEHSTVYADYHFQVGKIHQAELELKSTWNNVAVTIFQKNVKICLTIGQH